MRDLSRPEVHSFAPVDSTCGQAGCHIGTDIVLGAMGEQTALHCATCHVFATEVPLLATRDSAAGALRPGEGQCFSCHAMRSVLEEFDAASDPHGGTCGMCHNPHEQERSSDALTTCATSGCHDNWQVRPFHVGTQHVNVGDNCTLCHAPHSARVDPSDCQGCHASIAGRDDVPESMRQRLRRVAPFDTSAVLRRIRDPFENLDPFAMPRVAGGCLLGDRQPARVGQGFIADDLTLVHAIDLTL